MTKFDNVFIYCVIEIFKGGMLWKKVYKGKGLGLFGYYLFCGKLKTIKK